MGWREEVVEIWTELLWVVCGAHLHYGEELLTVLQNIFQFITVHVRENRVGEEISGGEGEREGGRERGKEGGKLEEKTDRKGGKEGRREEGRREVGRVSRDDCHGYCPE